MYTMDLIHLLAAVLSMKRKKKLTKKRNHTEECNIMFVGILSLFGHAPGSWGKQVSIVQVELVFPKRLQEFVQVKDV